MTRRRTPLLVGRLVTWAILSAGIALMAFFDQRIPGLVTFLIIAGVTIIASAIGALLENRLKARLESRLERKLRRRLGYQIENSMELRPASRLQYWNPDSEFSFYQKMNRITSSESPELLRSSATALSSLVPVLASIVEARAAAVLRDRTHYEPTSLFEIRAKLEEAGVWTPEQLEAFDELMRVRNQVVHSEHPSRSELNRAIEIGRQLSQSLEGPGEEEASPQR